MASILAINANGWHQGETKIHSLLHVSTSSRRNPSSQGLPRHYGHRIADSPLLALGAVDSQGRPWTTLWAGERGFVRPVANGVVAAQALVSVNADPVVEALLGSAKTGEVVQPASSGREVLVSGLAIDPESRDRVKFAGQLVVGVKGGGNEKTGVGEVQMAVSVGESLGNCPKYINKRVVRGVVGKPEVVESGGRLGAEGRRVVANADCFFVSSLGGKGDTNHRGGAKGFVRVLEQDGRDVLVYPEFSGNQLYQTLGNLAVDGRVGVVVPDFETGDAVFVTGRADVLAGEPAVEVMPRQKLVVRIVVEEARFVREGLAFRGVLDEMSPYNPPVRRLANEVDVVVPRDGEGALGVATLVKREFLTSRVARFSFKVRPGEGAEVDVWKAGQHATFGFAGELDHGYSHMRDDDPQSLNDDFVRTFTISNPPGSTAGKLVDGAELQITVKRHGPATGLLWRWNLQVPLELPLLAFGGHESFRISSSERKAVFIAGGVGITPLLAQAAAFIESGRTLSLIWSLRIEDLGLAIDTFERVPGLERLTQIFLTGTKQGSEEEAQAIEGLKATGAQVVQGRLTQSHLLGTGDEKGTRYYVCTSPQMLTVVQGWLEGQDVVTESFSY
ncbi:hypothetical protein OQA88_9592 [Cercophora sp. LCS_1]